MPNQLEAKGDVRVDLDQRDHGRSASSIVGETAVHDDFVEIKDAIYGQCAARAYRQERASGGPIGGSSRKRA
jgi:hypothetical protein